MGEQIFVQSADRSDDECTSLSERASKNITKYESNDDYARQACEKWMDVRTFGQVFAFKPNKDKKEKEGVSVGVRGPVSVHQAVSCSPVDVNSMQITKSVNSEPEKGKSSDTMGTEHNTKIGQYSAAKVHDSLKISLKKDVLVPASVDDYEIRVEHLPELEPEVIEGI